MSRKVRRYSVDARSHPEDRWESVIQHPWAANAAERLCSAVWQDAQETMPTAIAHMGSLATRAVFAVMDDNGTGYYEEVKAWHKGAVSSMSQLIFGNLLYELSSVGDLCTSVAFHTPRHGMVHARNLDWPLPAIKKSTILVDFETDEGPYTAVTMPGYVGVLSGVAPGRFSATINAHINYTEEVQWPNLTGWPASFALRWVFENCATYDAAVADLLATEVVSDFYVQVVGTQKGEAAIVRMCRDAPNELIEYGRGPLGIANHWPDDSNYRDLEWEDGSCTDSIDRLHAIQATARKTVGRTLRGCFKPLNATPVNNENTMQSMVFCPESGEVLLG